MANLDLKYYWAVFQRRLPYFLVIATLLAAIGITIASILPPVYQSSASLLAEPQQIPGSSPTPPPRSIRSSRSRSSSSGS